MFQGVVLKAALLKYASLHLVGAKSSGHLALQSGDAHSIEVATHMVGNVEVAQPPRKGGTQHAALVSCCMTKSDVVPVRGVVDASEREGVRHREKRNWIQGARRRSESAVAILEGALRLSRAAAKMA